MAQRLGVSKLHRIGHGAAHRIGDAGARPDAVKRRVEVASSQSTAGHASGKRVPHGEAVFGKRFREAAGLRHGLMLTLPNPAPHAAPSICACPPADRSLWRTGPEPSQMA